MNMASLEAVVYPQEYPVNYYGNYRDCNNSNNHSFGVASTWSCYDHHDLCLQEYEDKAIFTMFEQQQQQALHATTTTTTTTNNNNWDSPSSSMMQNSKGHNQIWDRYPNNSSPETNCNVDHGVKLLHPLTTTTTTSIGRRKRRRAKSTKNREEIENQRMTHIAVERNRRKQMNEYLAVLRSLMPPSYVQRGDQASIIGGAINFVKEVEQLLQTMESNKRSKQQLESNGLASSPFADFFTFPQYTTHTTTVQSTGDESTTLPVQNQHKWGVADIEVTMVESHANLKILSKKRPRQLLQLVAGLQGLRLSILHLNVTTVDQLVMYSVSLKIEEGCHLSSVDEIAAAVNQVLHKIAEDHNATSTFS